MLCRLLLAQVLLYVVNPKLRTSAAVLGFFRALTFSHCSASEQRHGKRHAQTRRLQLRWSKAVGVALDALFILNG